MSNPFDGMEWRRPFPPARGRRPEEVQRDGHDCMGRLAEEDRFLPIVTYPDPALQCISEPYPRADRRTRPDVFSRN